MVIHKLSYVIVWGIVLGALMFLCSCAASEPQIVYKQVPAPYPVIEHCKVTLPTLPVLPIGDLKPDSPSDQTFGSYIDTVIVLKNAVTLRDRLLKVCVDANPDTK